MLIQMMMMLVLMTQTKAGRSWRSAPVQASTMSPRGVTQGSRWVGVYSNMEGEDGNKGRKTWKGTLEKEKRGQSRGIKYSKDRDGKTNNEESEENSAGSRSRRQVRADWEPGRSHREKGMSGWRTRRTQRRETGTEKDRGGRLGTGKENGQEPSQYEGDGMLCKRLQHVGSFMYPQHGSKNSQFPHEKTQMALYVGSQVTHFVCCPLQH